MDWDYINSLKKDISEQNLITRKSVVSIQPYNTKQLVTKESTVNETKLNTNASNAITTRSSRAI